MGASDTLLTNVIFRCFVRAFRDVVAQCHKRFFGTEIMLSWLLGYSTAKQDSAKKLSSIKDDDLKAIIDGLYPTRLPGVCRNAPKSFLKFKRLLKESPPTITPHDLVMEKKMLSSDRHMDILSSISVARAYIERSENVEGSWDRIPRPPPLPAWLLAEPQMQAESPQDVVSQISNDLLASAMKKLSPVPLVEDLGKLESSFLFNILDTKSSLKKVSENQMSLYNKSWESPPLFRDIRSFDKRGLRSIV